MANARRDDEALARLRRNAGLRRNALSFSADIKEREYQSWRLPALVERTRWVLLIAAMLFTVFAIKDIWLTPTWYAPVSLAVQVGGIATPLLVVTWLLPHVSERLYQALIFAVALIISVCLIGLIAFANTRGLPLPYEGLLLFLVTTALLTGIRVVLAALICWFATTLYTLAMGMTGVPMDVVIFQFFYLGATSTIAVIGALFFDRSDRLRFVVEQHLTTQATNDFLTGIPNRRATEAAYETLWRLAHKNQVSLAVLRIDLDQFKQFNDVQGHAAGDEALANVANTLARNLKRPLDAIGRLGNDEFLVAAYDMDLHEALALGEQLRAAITALQITPGHLPNNPPLSVSVGITACEPWHQASSYQCWDVATQALGRAKRGGRNRVCSQVTPTPSAPSRT